MKLRKKNARQQLLRSITGKNQITDVDHKFFALSPTMGRFELLCSTDFSNNYIWSRAICETLENRDPEIAEKEQNLINRNIKTKRQNIKISKKRYIYTKLLIKKSYH